MKTPLAQSLLAVAIAGLAIALVLISALTDNQKTTTNLTYDEDDRYFLNEWKDAGGGEMMTSGIPTNVRKQFDITDRTMAPEVFFSREFQIALLISAEPFSVSGELATEMNQFTFSPTADNELPTSVANEKRKWAAISRLRSPDQLPPEMIKVLQSRHPQSEGVRLMLAENHRKILDDELVATIPIDEAFDMLHPTDRARLEQYRKRLTDHFSIREIARQEMSHADRLAANRLLRHAEKYR